MESDNLPSQQPPDSEEHFQKELKDCAQLRLLLDLAITDNDTSLAISALEQEWHKKLNNTLRPMAAKRGLTKEKLDEMICSCIKKIQAQRPKVPKLPDEKELQSVRVVSICSDVHLGTGYARKQEFYQWLESRQADETVVLLGDILDCWIFSKDDDEESLLRRVIAEWTELWTALSQLHKQGTKIHYIPGNHDAFVFFIEMVDLVPWCRIVMEHSQEFETIKTQTPRLRELASIHYPFFQLEVNGEKMLLTHGHYQSWGWRLMAGVAGDDAPVERNLFLATASVVLAHKHARLLRRVVNEIDWMRRVHGIEDMAISITNLVVTAFEAARKTRMNDDDIGRLIDSAMAIYFGGQKTGSAYTLTEEIGIRDALLRLVRLQGKRMPNDLNEIWNDTMSYLSRSPSEKSVSCGVCSANGPCHVTWTPFQTFLTPDKLVFGHYHKPRNDARAYDVGGFVKPVSTHLSILGDGSLSREL